MGLKSRESLCLMNEEENCFCKITAVSFYRKIIRTCHYTNDLSQQQQRQLTI